MTDSINKGEPFGDSPDTVRFTMSLRAMMGSRYPAGVLARQSVFGSIINPLPERKARVFRTAKNNKKWGATGSHTIALGVEFIRKLGCYPSGHARAGRRMSIIGSELSRGHRPESIS